MRRFLSNKLARLAMKCTFSPLTHYLTLLYHIAVYDGVQNV